MHNCTTHETRAHTHTRAVSEDNMSRLRAGSALAGMVVSTSLAALSSSSPSSPSPPTTLCLNASATPCPALCETLAAGMAVQLTVYNPLAWEWQGAVVEAIVPGENYTAVQLVEGVGGAAMQQQQQQQQRPVACQTAPIPTGALPDLPAPVGSSPSWYFLACTLDLPPLGGATVLLFPASASAPAAGAASQVHAAPTSAQPVTRSVVQTLVGSSASSEATMSTTTSPLQLSNAYLTLSFDDSGALVGISTPAVNVSAQASVVVFSSPAGSENAWDFSTAGSYTPLPWPSSPPGALPALTYSTGPLFSELTVTPSPTATDLCLRWRLYAGEAQVRLYVGVGPFNETTSSGATATTGRTGSQSSGGGGGATATAAPTHPPSMDAFLSLRTGLRSGGLFYTDSNGLELLPRQRWSRPFAPGVNYSGYAGDEPVAINTYPVTSAAVLPGGVGGEGALALLPALGSHAATSLVDGSLELMVNRDVIDGGGARKTGNRRTTSALALSLHPTTTSATTASRRAAALLAAPPLLAVSPWSGGSGPSLPSLASSLATPLPPTLHLLSLQLLPAGLNLTRYFSGTGGGGRQHQHQHQHQHHHQQQQQQQPVVLLRVRHMYQAGLDDPSAAVPALVDPTTLFSPRWTVASVEEVTLDGGRGLAQAAGEQVQWPQAGPAAGAGAWAPTGGTGMASGGGGGKGGKGGKGGAAPVTVLPGEIKTFFLVLQ
jgi:hypothetical protein